MIKYIISLGLNDKDTKTQLIDTITAYKKANEIILKYIDGATVYETQGIFKHNDGTITIERSLQIELWDASKKAIENITNELKTAFNQEAVNVQIQEVTSYMV